MGHEDTAHIRMEYKVKLVDYPEQPIIVCKRLMPQASFDGVGQYYPLEDGDPVIILAKEGNLEDGLIIGSPYLPGSYEEYAVKGKILDPTNLIPQSVDPYRANQPSIHPDRIAEPDAFFWVIGGKKTNDTFNDPSFYYTKESKAANRPQPVSIEVRNKHGDYAIWCNGDHITYTDKDVIVVSNADGKTACQRHQETASYYMGIAKTLKRAFGAGTNEQSKDIDEINTGEDIVSLMTGTSKKSTEQLINNPITTQMSSASFQSINQLINNQEGNSNDNNNNERPNLEEESSIQERLSPYINGMANPSHLQYSKAPYYQIEESLKAARKAQQLAQSCNENSMINTVTNQKAMNVLSPSPSSSCAMGDKDCTDVPNEFQLDQEDTERLQTLEGKLVIAIDPGHGGSDPGAIGYQGIKEKDIVLKVSQMLKSELESKGISTILTREEDIDVSLSERVNIAEKANSKLFISIHNNASLSGDANGIETYYYNSSDVYSKISSSLANLIQGSLTTAFPNTPNRKVKTANFYVIKRNPIPSVLIELGFIDGSIDGPQLASGEMLSIASKVIANSIQNNIKQ
jgi:N-acetylmuramoyl-L-alanine amidase